MNDYGQDTLDRAERTIDAMLEVLRTVTPENEWSDCYLCDLQTPHGACEPYARNLR